MATVDYSRIVIGIPTLGTRPLTRLLGEIRSQAPGADLVVMFNGAEHMFGTVEEQASTSRARVLECSRGYASARNALIDYARSVDRPIIFFDDDQHPQKGWFSSMTAAAHAPNVCGVVGPVRAIVPRNAWAKSGDIRPQRFARAGRYDYDGYSGNTLLNLHRIDPGLRFGLEWDKLGGEDTEFFRRLVSSGCELHFAPGAVAVEFVDADRLTAKGRFVRGIELSRRSAALNGRSKARTLRRTIRALRGVALAAVGIVLFRRDIAGRGMFDLGMAVGYFFRAGHV